jgi:hypothetical protein
MPTLHGTNTWNVEATITQYFIDELAAIARPPQLPSYTTIVNLPEQAIVTPAFSYANLPAGTRYLYMGNNVGDGLKGGKSFGILEVSAWVSRGAANWSAQLKIMQAMIEQVAVKANNGIVVKDYASNLSAPVTLPFLIRIIELEVVATAPDANPDLGRRRCLISFSWIHRA